MRPRESASIPTAGKIQFVHISLPADRIQQRIALNLLLALEIRDDRAIRHLFDRLHLFVQPHRHPRVAQMIAQRLDDLLIGKLQQPRPPLDQRHPHPKRRKHAGVLHADHAAADDNHRLRQVHQLQHQVAVDDAAPIDRHLRRRRRLGSGANQDILGLVDGRPARVRHLDMGRIFKARHTHQHLDVVARELRLGHIDLGLDHMLHPERQVRHRDPFLHPVVHPIDGLVVIPREMQHRLAHRLRRNRACVDAGAADHLAHLHQRNLFAQLGCIDRGPLPGGPGPNDNQIVNTTHSDTYSWIFSHQGHSGSSPVIGRENTTGEGPSSPMLDRFASLF